MLGALMSIGVLSNVVALNFSYDVPVKLFSSHLLAMAVFVILPDVRRLADFFILNRATERVSEQPLFRRTAFRRGALVVASLFAIAVVGTSLYQSYDQRRTFVAERSPLYGVWEVEEFNLGSAQPASAQRWRRVIFDSPRRITVTTATDLQERYGSQLDQEKRTLT